MHIPEWLEQVGGEMKLAGAIRAGRIEITGDQVSAWHPDGFKNRIDLDKAVVKSEFGDDQDIPLDSYFVRAIRHRVKI